MGLLSNNKIANIEIQDYVIRYSEIRHNKKPIIVTNINQHYLPEGIVENGKVVNHELFLRTLRKCVRKWNLKGKQIRFIVPDSSVIVRTVQVPANIEEEEIKGHIYFELGHSIHLPFDNPVIDTAILEKNEEFQQVLLVASPTELIDLYQVFFENEKTNPIVADISALCQYRLFYHYDLTNSKDNYLLVQFNVKSVTLSIFEKHKPVFSQQITIPYLDDTLFQQIGSLTKEQFNIKKMLLAFEEVYTEIERVLRFYQYSLNKGDKKITKFLATGDHPYINEVLDGVKNRMDQIPVITLDPRTIQTTKDVKIDYQFYNVIGLAMKEGF
ncbi:pilus assembly protein PilM [Bacillaceae bacterium S4-13-58]